MRFALAAASNSITDVCFLPFAGRSSDQRDGGRCAISNMNEWQKMGSW
ncbi:hypothetical protein SUS17_2686 [Sphingomonas sp. S17]|nr:hypothetical protein SUS17_2686 [Sphingomonas sp. S17]